jgi:aryl-alcohol dehydrogenase-like predicted oxidoreductase
VHKLPLVLGTAQLGMDYGINNAGGKPNAALAEDIVQTAVDSGIAYFDTAQSYGDSEYRLGHIIQKHSMQAKINIISKLAPEVSLSDMASVLASIRKSIQLLGVSKLHALLIHNELDIVSVTQQKSQTIQAILDHGLADHVGVSLYTPDIGKACLGMPNISYFQVPANIWDRRFDWFIQEALQHRHCVDIRSIFLQGLLLMDPKTLPNRVRHCQPNLVELHKTAKEAQCSVKALALSYIRHQFPQCRYVIGVDHPDYIDDNIQLLNYSRQIQSLDYSHLAVSNLRIINPALWETA